MTLNELADLIAAANREKGFTVDRAALDRPLLLIVSEIVEAQEELRMGREPEEVYWEDRADTAAPKPCGFGIELADALIRILHLAGALGLDLDGLVAQKLSFNRTRPAKHGREF